MSLPLGKLPYFPSTLLLLLFCAFSFNWSFTSQLFFLDYELLSRRFQTTHVTFVLFCACAFPFFKLNCTDRLQPLQRNPGSFVIFIHSLSTPKISIISASGTMFLYVLRSWPWYQVLGVESFTNAFKHNENPEHRVVFYDQWNMRVMSPF